MNYEKYKSLSFSKTYPFLLRKVERKNRSKAELDEIIRWLTGYSQEELETCINKEISYKEFFDQAPNMNANRKLIKGVICGLRVEEIEDPLAQEVRYLDKLVDELYKGKGLEKIKRTPK